MFLPFKTRVAMIGAFDIQEKQINLIFVIR
jgi:hypothetical protein